MKTGDRVIFQGENLPDYEYAGYREGTTQYARVIAAEGGLAFVRVDRIVFRDGGAVCDPRQVLRFIEVKYCEEARQADQEAE